MRCCSSRMRPSGGRRCSYYVVADAGMPRTRGGACRETSLAWLSEPETRDPARWCLAFSLLERGAAAAARTRSPRRTKIPTRPAIWRRWSSLKDVSVAFVPREARAASGGWPHVGLRSEDAADALASTVVQLFDPGEDRWCTSKTIRLRGCCVPAGVGGLGSGVGARALGDALERAGFAKKCSQALVKRLPTTSPKFAWSSTGTESTEWTECAVKDERIIVALLKALKGCCASSERCAKTAIKDKAVESAHALELLLAPSSVCLAAEELVDACVAWPSGSKAGHARGLRNAVWIMPQNATAS